MSLALGDAILAYDGRVEPLACAQAFDAWMRGKPVDIGNTVRRNLITFRQTGDPGRAAFRSRRRQWRGDARAAGGAGHARAGR